MLHATRMKGMGDEGLKARLQEARVQEAKLEARLQEVALARRALEEECTLEEGCALEEEEYGSEEHVILTATRSTTTPKHVQPSTDIAPQQLVVAVSSWYDGGFRLTAAEVVEPVAVVSWYDTGLRLTQRVVRPATVVSWYDAGFRLSPEVVELLVAVPSWYDAGLRLTPELTVVVSACYDDAGLRRPAQHRVMQRPTGRLEEAAEPAAAPTMEAAMEDAEPAVEVAPSAESWISCGRDASGVRLTPPQAPAIEMAPDPLLPLPLPPKWEQVQADKHGFHQW